MQIRTYKMYTKKEGARVMCMWIAMCLAVRYCCFVKCLIVCIVLLVSFPHAYTHFSTLFEYCRVCECGALFMILLTGLLQMCVWMCMRVLICENKKELTEWNSVNGRALECSLCRTVCVWVNGDKILSSLQLEWLRVINSNIVNFVVKLYE